MNDGSIAAKGQRGADAKQQKTPVGILYRTVGFEAVVGAVLRACPDVIVVGSGRTWPLPGEEFRETKPRVIVVECTRAKRSGLVVPTALLRDGVVDRIVLCSLDERTTTILVKKQIYNITSAQFVDEIVS